MRIFVILPLANMLMVDKVHITASAIHEVQSRTKQLSLSYFWCRLTISANEVNNRLKWYRLTSYITSKQHNINSSKVNNYYEKKMNTNICYKFIRFHIFLVSCEHFMHQSTFIIIQRVIFLLFIKCFWWSLLIEKR